MYSFEICFPVLSASPDGVDEVIHLLHWTLRDLEYCHRIHSGWNLVPHKGVFKAYGTTYSEACLASPSFQPKDIAEIHSICEHGFGVPIISVYETSTRTETVPEVATENLFLFTTFLDRYSPIVSGANGTALSGYLLNLSQDLLADLGRWTDLYRKYDDIQMSCGELELPAVWAIQDPFSDLSTLGRTICQKIEISTGLPTYYYLYRYEEFPINSTSRPCPICGSDWFQKPQGELYKSILSFPFRCESCRIVSVIGPTLSNSPAPLVGYWWFSDQQRAHFGLSTVSTAG